MTAIPPGLLVTPALLSRFGVPPSFLAQFQLRPFQLQIVVGGALGVMQFQWQFVGDPAWSAPIVSSAGTTWGYTIDNAFVDLIFAAGPYVPNQIYTVDANGAVSPSGITATMFDLRQNACSAVTTEAMMLMRDAIRPPLITWGDDATGHAAAMVYAWLKRARGATPVDVGAGDQVVFDGEKLGRDFFKFIGEGGKPDSMTDSSTTADGPLIPAYPSGDDERGW